MDEQEVINRLRPKIRAVALYTNTPSEKLIRLHYPRELEGEVVKRIEQSLGIKVDIRQID